MRAAAGAADPLDQLGEPVLAPRPDDDRGALGREQLGGGGADARRAPGDRDAATLQGLAH
jgi:hypothetical protein